VNRTGGPDRAAAGKLAVEILHETREIQIE